MKSNAQGGNAADAEAGEAKVSTNGNAPPAELTNGQDPFHAAAPLGRNALCADVDGRLPEDDGYNPFGTKRKAALAASTLSPWDARNATVTHIKQNTAQWNAKRQIALTEVERVCGKDIAEAAAQAITQHNRDIWNTEGAGFLHALPYLVTVGDLVTRFDVPVEQADDMADASPDARSEALERTAVAKKEHAASIVRKAKSAATTRQPLAEVIRHVADMVNDEPTGTIVDGLIYEQMVIHWIGDGGTYKTFTALALGCSVAAGRDFTSQLKVAEKQRVLYLCAERRHFGLVADVAAWCQVSGIDIRSLDLLAWDDVVQLGDDVWMAELIEFVKAQEIKLIVFDTQRKATRGLEENSATDMSVALSNAQKLAMEANAAVIVIHHTTRDKDHARGTTAWHDDTDATLLQALTGPSEGAIVIQKHKSEEAGTTYPIKVQKVSGTVPATKGGAGCTYRTLVATARDPLSMDETAEKVYAALSNDDKILVAVVNDNDGPPLSPAEVFRRASLRGFGLKTDAAATHLRQLAGCGLITETVDPVSHRKTYSAKASAAAPPKDASDGPTDVSADFVDLAAARKKPRKKPTGTPSSAPPAAD